MAKEAEIGEIEAHGENATFGFYEARLNILSIVIDYFNAILSFNAKLTAACKACHYAVCIAASSRIG